MTQFLKQRKPGPVAIKKGIDSLIACEEARHGGHWKVVSPPDGLKWTRAMRSRHVDSFGVVTPDDKHAVGGRGSSGRPSDEDVANHPRQEISESVAVKVTEGAL